MKCINLQRILVITLIVGGCTLFSPPTGRAAETTLATVNGQAITGSDLNMEQNLLKMEMRLRNRPVSEQQIRSMHDEIIDNLVTREMLFQYAGEKNIKARSQWVESALDDLKEQLGGRSALKAYMADVGITQDQLKTHLDKGLVVRRLLRLEAVRSVKVSEAEKEAYYRNHPEYFLRGEQVRVRHILVTEKGARAQSASSARARIQALQNQIRMGADLAVLALEYSDCPSRSSAGDLGFLTREQMVDDFADAAFALQPGEISGIVTTRFGYHLIQMMDRRPPEKITYKEAREKIERTLRRNKENRAVDRFVAQIRKNSDIKLSRQ